MARGTPTLEELLSLALEAKLATVNVALPGKVEAYDAATQRADIRPLVQRAVPTPDEDYILENLPVIPNVRVIHPGGEDWAIHVPIKVGDTVELVFQQWDPSEWMRTGQVSEPADKRRFSLAHAVAIPGYRKNGQNIQGASADNLTIRHKDGFEVAFTPDAMEVAGSSDAAAKASAVKDELDDLKAVFTTWVVSPNDGGAALKLAVATWAGTPASVASTKLKVGG